MDLLFLLRVLSRHRFLILLGIFIGVLFSLNMVYKTSITFTSIEFKPKPLTRYETSVSIMLTDPDFEIGRLKIDRKSSLYERIVSLTTTYSYMITSDEVLKRLEKKIGPLQAGIKATPVRGSSIINIEIEGMDVDHILDVAKQLPLVFSDVLNDQQDKNKIADSNRIYIKTLAAAREPSSSGSNTMEFLILGFLVPFFAMLGLAFIKENIDQRLITEKDREDVIEQIRETAL